MSLPVVPLDSIPTHGLSVALGDWARAACGQGLGGATEEVGGQLALARVGRRIHATGSLHGSASAPCDRCGEPLLFAVVGEVDCVYVPPEELSPAKDVDEATLSLVDEGEYDGVALDLSHVVAEFFALERPARLRCEDLDPTSDAACLERFRARANLGQPQPDPRFAVLRGVKPTH